MKRYMISCIKTGRAWKRQLKGVNYMIDDDLYRIDLKVDGLKNAIICWWKMLINKPNHGTFIIEK